MRTLFSQARLVTAIALAFTLAAFSSASAADGSDTKHPAAEAKGEGVSVKGAKETTFMFVQTAKEGTFHTENADNGSPDVQEYVLTLKGVAPDTVYFSDRPARIAGSVPNDKFLANLGFEASNPPNAAVVLAHPVDQSHDVVIVQLLNPKYDATAETLTYDVVLMKHYSGKGLKHWVEMADPSLPDSFGQVSVFIDDCPDTGLTCFGAYQCMGRRCCRVGCGGTGKTIGTCWDWYSFSCKPCRDYTAECSKPGGPCDNVYPFCLRNKCSTSHTCT